MTTIDMFPEQIIEMLEQRVSNLESALMQTTDFLDDLYTNADLYSISNYLEEAAEIVGESRSVLEGEFEE